MPRQVDLAGQASAASVDPEGSGPVDLEAAVAAADTVGTAPVFHSP